MGCKVTNNFWKNKSLYKKIHSFAKKMFGNGYFGVFFVSSAQC
jgi:hypothetical protein